MQKFASRARDIVSGRSLAVLAASALPLASMAQVTDPFDAAVATVTDKVEAYGAALVTLSAVAIVFYIAMKFIKKIPKST